MYRELLFALSGYPGAVFKKECTDNKHVDHSVVLKPVKVIQGLPFIHPCEEAILNRLLQLGGWYMYFQQFISHCRYGGRLEKTDYKDGLRDGRYLRALCDGLENVLQSYQTDLLKLEKDFMADPYLPITHILQALEHYHLLFPALCNVISDIITRKAHGCCILDVLHNHSVNGVQLIADNIKIIMKTCHYALYKQLYAWLLHGLLLDDQNEFFIRKNTSAIRKSFNASEIQKDDCQFSPAGAYVLDASMLPSYVAIRVAEQVLFIGESVQLFSDRKCKHKEPLDTIFKAREQEFANDMHELQERDHFSLSEFEQVIGKIRNCIAERLWQLVVEEADLIKHLELVKNMYLLGRGELFLAFIDAVDHQLSTVPSSSTEHDINTAFQQVTRNVMERDDCLLDPFHFTLTTNATSSINSGWSMLHMTYQVQWPLHILFTQSVLERYNSIFKFLLSVSRAQAALHNCWAVLMQHKHLTSSFTSAVWMLHNHLTFLINNLQYYLMVDVLESQFEILLNKIRTTKDFEAIILAHETFLNVILAQTFILLKPASQCISEILILCHTFCKSAEDSFAQRSQHRIEEVNNISKSFSRHTSLLFKILSGVRSHQSSLHLAKLLTHVDFNKYFSNSGCQLGPSVNDKLTKTTFEVQAEKFTDDQN